MPDILFIAGFVLIPLGFGLVPGMLPRRVPLTSRWALWLALLAISGWYLSSMREAPQPSPWLALVPFWLSSLLSLYVLVAETGRAGINRKTTKRPG